MFWGENEGVYVNLENFEDSEDLECDEDGTELVDGVSLSLSRLERLWRGMRKWRRMEEAGLEGDGEAEAEVDG